VKMERALSESFLSELRTVAPGTLIREGLENILRAKTGSLLVIGDSPEVRAIVEGGFEVNVPLTATRIYELAKMDGAIILDDKAENIWKANAQLVPQGNISSDETGIRHRTAERVARQTGAMVIAISQRRSLITIFKGTMKFVLPDISLILTKANQAIQTLEKYRSVLEKALLNLSVLEFENVVTVMDVSKVVQRIEMVKWIVNEIDLYLAQLGTEGRLVSMQLEELVSNVYKKGHLVLLDYIYDEEKGLEIFQKSLKGLSTEDLLELTNISKILGYGNNLSSLDTGVSPRGYRILNEIPRLPFPVIENLVKHFRTLHNVLDASIEELDQVEGIGEVRARAIKNGLTKLRQQILMDWHF
jgi:diadenylate cyclase